MINLAAGTEFDWATRLELRGHLQDEEYDLPLAVRGCGDSVELANDDDGSAPRGQSC